MNKQKALEVKEQILDKIIDTIPASVVSPLWAVYVDEFNPSDKVCPCPCAGGKTWLPIVDKVRARVTEALNADVYVVANQEIVEVKKKEPLEELQAQSKNRHTKKK